MRHELCAVLLLAAVSVAQTPNNPPAGAPSLEKQKVLWQKLESTIHDVDQHLDGVMGVAMFSFGVGIAKGSRSKGKRGNGRRE